MERHDTLLITSSVAENRTYLRDALCEGFNLLEAVNVKQMLLLLQQNSNCIAALLLDITKLNDGDKALISEPESIDLLKNVQVIIFTDDDFTYTFCTTDLQVTNFICKKSDFSDSRIFRFES